MTPFAIALVLGTAMDKRPSTFHTDPGLTTGSIVNFRELYVDPNSVAATLKPVQAEQAAGVAQLSVVNDFMSWGEVMVGDVKVGVIGPLTEGAIKGVKPGTYDVKVTYANGYVSEQQVDARTAGPTAEIEHKQSSKDNAAPPNDESSGNEEPATK